MNYEIAASKLLETRDAIEQLEREFKQAVAPLKERAVALENWFSAKAQEDGLEKVPTSLGLAYWSNHSSATVASRELLLNHARENGAWDLIDVRASKTGVKSYVTEHGEPPPGVNYSTVRVFNFRKDSGDKA